MPRAIAAPTSAASLGALGHAQELFYIGPKAHIQPRRLSIRAFNRRLTIECSSIQEGASYKIPSGCLLGSRAARSHLMVMAMPKANAFCARASRSPQRARCCITHLAWHWWAETRRCRALRAGASDDSRSHECALFIRLRSRVAFDGQIRCGTG
jgi:hypothetical protein